MKRKPIAVIGLISPVILISLCLIGVLFMGLVSWLFFSADNGQIVKIATVGPFFNFKVFDTAEAGEDSTGPAEVQVPAAASQTEPVSGAPVVEASASSLSAEEVEEALGFSLPPNSVNSVTQEGVGTRLVIPKLNLDAPVLLAPIENQTWKVDHLDQAVGHLEGTAQPGANSNLVLAGHVTLNTGVYGPFAGLGRLEPGDSIFVYQGDKQFEYVVDSHNTVDRTAVEVTYPTEDAQITLITCNNWDSVEGRYVERLVVKGHLTTGG